MTVVEHDLDFGLLGPLVVARAGVVLDPGRRRQRLLVIRLLLADGRTVASETLCEELWPQQPGRTPGGATASLHAHVSKVRAVLEPQHLRGRGTFEVLVTEPGGYALRVPPECRDTVRFERAVALAHRLLDQGRPADAVQEAERALEMWRGAALADAAHHLFAAPEAARLEELRQSVREIRATALLLDGRTLEAVEAAQELTARHPLRETGWALLLRALYLAGRHPEALRRYADLRRHLADEFGLDPSPVLRALHDGILRHDLPPLHSAEAVKGPGPVSAPGAGTGDGSDPHVPAPSGASEEGKATTPAAAAPSGESGAPTGPGDEGEPLSSVRPAQLPGDLPVFAGRTTESAWLSAVSGAPGRPGPAGAPVVVIGGAPG
ncbi:BTAD domain-containing putative transcriptional regulator, partial [Streptomyces sp. NPDC057052]|uniref:AfsR/SARP family transcriptional regulator n=1 Tax=Streptomyces sp. NPDC057052 TaxID=3346010 RepID=UPI0036431C21